MDVVYAWNRGKFQLLVDTQKSEKSLKGNGRIHKEHDQERRKVIPKMYGITTGYSCD